MQANCYLIVNRKGAVRTTKRQPALEWDEIAIEVALTLPAALFQRPQLRAAVNVGELALIDLDAEVIDNIEEAIHKTAGVEVKLEIVSASLEAQPDA